MTTEITAKIINSIGLILDIVGAGLVAWEALYRHEGTKFGRPKYQDAADNASYPPRESPTYKKLEQDKYRKMKIGLWVLLVGFVFQIASNWLPYFIENKTTPKNSQETTIPRTPTKPTQLTLLSGFLDFSALHRNFG